MCRGHPWRSVRSNSPVRRQKNLRLTPGGGGLDFQASLSFSQLHAVHQSGHCCAGGLKAEGRRSGSAAAAPALMEGSLSATLTCFGGATTNRGG